MAASPLIFILAAGPTGGTPVERPASVTGLLAVVLGLYLAGLLALSVWSGRRVHNEEDYLVAGRRLPLWLAWGTLLATWFGAATVLGAAEAARDAGLRGTVLDPFASGIALIVAGLFFARPLWEMRLLTIGDFYRRTFGPRSEMLASLILVPGYFGWIAAQYVALAGLQNTFFDIPPQWGIVVAASVILVYTMIGGMWSVTLTDALQMAVVMVTLVILGAVTFQALGGGSVTTGFDRLIGETPADSLTLLPQAGAAAGLAWVAVWGSGVFGNIPGQDLTQRIFAARDSRTAVMACVLAGVIYLAFGLLPVGMGLASRLLVPEEGGRDILGILAGQYLTPTLAVVFVVAVVSIIVSTCTSAVLAPASILGHNLLGRLGSVQRRKLLTSRLCVLTVTLASVAVAFTGRTILELLELSLSTVLVALFVPLVMGLYGRPRGELPALLAMVCGSAVWLARELLEGLLLPMSDQFAGRGAEYAEYIEAVHLSSGTDVAGWLLYGFALVPSALSGTAASFAGYLLGQKLSGRASEK